MISILNNPHSTVNVTAPTKRLARAIMVSQGQFSLLLVCCNSTPKQQQILSLLKEFSPVEIKEILLAPSAETLYTTIKTILGETQPEALIVKGLESVTAINQLIISTNLMRDELKKQFQFPLVLCVNDEILRKLIWLAPDLKNWAASTIRFDQSNDQFIERQPLSA